MKYNVFKQSKIGVKTLAKQIESDEIIVLEGQMDIFDVLGRDDAESSLRDNAVSVPQEHAKSNENEIPSPTPKQMLLCRKLGKR